MVDERRKNHLAGISPGTVLALAIAISSVIGSWYVMRDDINDNMRLLEKHERDNKDAHKALWYQVNTHTHRN